MASNFPNPEEINEDTGALWESGDTWTDSESGYTYIYSPANGQSRWRMQSGTYTTPNLQSVTDAGNNTTNDITLGTDKITLDATDGSASFASDAVQIQGSSGQLYWDQPTGFLAMYGQRSGTGTFAITSDGQIRLGGADPTDSSKTNILLEGDDGSAEFAGDVVVGSRNKKWMLVESNGLCHMVEQSRASTADLVAPAAEYPPLRDVFAELNAIESALAQVMEKLRMTPPAGWEVWDGSSENS